MWKGTKLSNLRSTITNMELHNLKSGAPHVELCGYIIELWYSAILWFCSHIKTVGSQILRARVKWFSRYLALSREGHNSGIQDHRPALPGVYNSQTVCWAIIEVLTFPGSLHIDIAPATNHNKQHWILIIMQQNCQITRCARQHTMDSVLKSAKLRRDLTGNRTGFTHARSTLRGRVHQSWMSFSVTNSRIAFQIRFRHFRHNRNTKSDSGRWSYRPVNCICTKKYTVHRGSCRFSAGVEASVTWHTGFSQWRPLFVDSRRQIAQSQNRRRMCEIRLTKLSCAAQQEGIVHFYAVTDIKGLSCPLWWMREWRNLLTSTHVGYRSVIRAVASGVSLKFGVQGASATNWLSRVNGARDNGIRLYSPEKPNLGQIRRFLEAATLKFDGWPWKTIGHLFYATSSFVHHFVAIGEFKLQLQSGNAQSGSNSTIFRGVRPWNLTDDLAKQ